VSWYFSFVMISFTNHWTVFTLHVVLGFSFILTQWVLCHLLFLTLIVLRVQLQKRFEAGNLTKTWYRPSFKWSYFNTAKVHSLLFVTKWSYFYTAKVHALLFVRRKSGTITMTWSNCSDNLLNSFTTCAQFWLFILSSYSFLTDIFPYALQPLILSHGSIQARVCFCLLLQ
jgi:hypothetical protein